MKTTPRFENAVTKLYKAFHEGRLRKGFCHMCAVGNMVGGRTEWYNYIIGKERGDECLKYKDKEGKQEGLYQINSTGYSLSEINKIEKLFETNTTKDMQGMFKGLCAVVEYLCELDNIPNVMSFQSLFEQENNAPVNKLQFA